MSRFGVQIRSQKASFRVVYLMEMFIVENKFTLVKRKIDEKQIWKSHEILMFHAHEILMFQTTKKAITVFSRVDEHFNRFFAPFLVLRLHFDTSDPVSKLNLSSRKRAKNG